jgi:hypothetical protein
VSFLLTPGCLDLVWVFRSIWIHVDSIVRQSWVAWSGSLPPREEEDDDEEEGNRRTQIVSYECSNTAPPSSVQNACSAYSYRCRQPFIFFPRFWRIKSGDLLLSRAGTDYFPRGIAFESSAPASLSLPFVFQSKSSSVRGKHSSRMQQLLKQRPAECMHASSSSIATMDCYYPFRPAYRQHVHISSFSKVWWRQSSSCPLSRAANARGLRAWP